MCDFWKGSFIEYTTALSPYFIAFASFIVAKMSGILEHFKNKDEILIRNTWTKIVMHAIESVHRPDENGIVHSPYPKTWEKVEKDAIELAKIEYPKEWEQYERLRKN